MLHLSGGIEVQERDVAIVLKADLTRVRFLAPLGINHSVVKNVRELAAESVGHGLYATDARVRGFPTSRNLVVVEVDVLHEGIVALVVGSEDLPSDRRSRGVPKCLVINHRL